MKNGWNIAENQMAVRKETRASSHVSWLGRCVCLLLTLCLFLSMAGQVRAEEEEEENIDLEQAVLQEAAEMDAELGKLRAVTVHVYNQEETRLPTEEDSPASAFLKTLAIGLQQRWDLEADEAETLSPQEWQELYRQYAAVELEGLEEYRDMSMDDPLLDFLRTAYLTSLDQQRKAAEESQMDIVAYRWNWNKYRQEEIKALFLLNRYFEVNVHGAYQEQITSYLYEGALLISENTLAKMLNDQEAVELSDLDFHEKMEEGDTLTIAYGPEVWHADSEDQYELRLHDFDAENLTMKVELRETDSGDQLMDGKISLSAWEKYVKTRQTIDTFYKVDNIAAEDGKISFQLYMNQLCDGRLYQEMKGKLSLRIPEKKEEAGQDNEEETEITASGLTDAAFPEAAIDQNFSGVKVGDTILMGYYEQDGNEENLREPIEWQVISLNKKKNVGLIVTTKGMEALSYGAPGDEELYMQAGYNWKNSYIREWMNDEFYAKSFTDQEKERIRLATNVTKDPSGRFTTREYVFLLSADEGRRYMRSKEGLACEATPHAMERLNMEKGAITEDGYCQWWVRELTNAVIINRDGSQKKNTCNEAGYVYGSLGLRFYLRSKGYEIYQNDIAVVRPAMWVKFD